MRRFNFHTVKQQNSQVVTSGLYSLQGKQIMNITLWLENLMGRYHSKVADINKTDFWEAGCTVVKWIKESEDKVKLCSFVFLTMNLQDP
jgi:hypothetical protein